MTLTELQEKIQPLTRYEKYSLLQYIVSDLAKQEELSLENITYIQVIHQSEGREISKEHSIEKFLKKWKGSLKSIDPDEAKNQYLQKKYK